MKGKNKVAGPIGNFRPNELFDRYNKKKSINLLVICNRRANGYADLQIGKHQLLLQVHH